MALKISASLKKSIANERALTPSDVEDYVWEHKPHACFLCGGELNRASDAIELDHHDPVGEGGTDDWDNLNLTHASCNRYKRDHSSIEVRPHLRFKRFWDEKSGAVNFKAAKEFYNLKETDIYIKFDESSRIAEISTEIGIQKVPVFSELVSSGELNFLFAEIPVSAVKNDDKIQPRNININHLLAIASDLATNPLHEQPCCRIIGGGEKKSLLLFDGQHKAVAELLRDRKSVVFKVYLNLNEQSAVRLVNSIQSQIKKLPLTPFELAAKMSDEVARQVADYEEDVGSLQVSEAGFINWLDPADRSRAKQGISSAVIDRVIGDEQLAFKAIIERKGIKIEGPVSLKEAAFQSNILKRMLFTKPLPTDFAGEKMKAARTREATNVIRLLNMIFERGFVVQPDKEPSTEGKRIERLAYQASLSYMSMIFTQLMASMIYPTNSEQTFLEKDIKDEVWDRMASYIERFFAHPVWTGDLTKGDKAKAVQDALSKNQNYEAAFREVGLTGGYCAGQDNLPKNWSGS